MDLNGNAWDGVSRQAGPPCGKCEGVAGLLQKQPCQVDQKNIVAVLIMRSLYFFQNLLVK